MRFKPGQSGNPAGRPKGARSKATIMAQTMLDGEAEAILKKVIEQAKAGDSTALRLCLDRILPPRKDRTVAFEAQDLQSAPDAKNASRAIIKAVADGEITPSEGVELSRIIESFTKIVETADLEERLVALERSMQRA